MGIKVLVENSTLVAASLNFFYEKLNQNIVDDHHKISIPLFEFFKEHIGEYGITTHKIEADTEATLKSIIKKRIRDLDLAKEEEFKAQSAIMMEIKRNFENIKKYLVIYPVEDGEVSKIMPEVIKMYDEVKGIIYKERGVKHPIFVRTGRLAKAMKWAIRDQEQQERRRYYKLIKKFQQAPPDVNDCQIIAQAHYLKKFKFKTDEIYITSTDFHFSKIKDYEPHETLVPDKIDEYFKVCCEWPDDMLKILKEKAA